MSRSNGKNQDELRDAPQDTRQQRQATYRDAASRGIGVDAYGSAVIDPTANVIALNTAANLRQDDLRELHMRLVESEIKRLEQGMTLRAELSAANRAHVEEIVRLSSRHNQELSAKESARLDSIRQVDQLAVSTAADRSAQAISALAATTTTNAENLRNSQAAMANTLSQQTTNSLNAITERIAALEKSSYEGAGKQAYQDPMMTELVSKMNSLLESRAGVSGRSSGISASWAVLIAVVVLVTGLLAIWRSAPIATSPTPQIIYATPPASAKVP